VRWNESSQILIQNALKPAEVAEISLCFELGRATVVVRDDQLSLAIGKRGQNVRLAARLTGWDIDILTPAEYNKGLDDMEKVLSEIEGIDDEKIDKMMAMGIISLMDVEEVGTGPMVNELGLTEELAEKVVSTASEAAKRIQAETAAAKAAEAAERSARAAEEVTEPGEGLGVGDATTGPGELTSLGSPSAADPTELSGGEEELAAAHDEAADEAMRRSAASQEAEVFLQAATEGVKLDTYPEEDSEGRVDAPITGGGKAVRIVDLPGEPGDQSSVETPMTDAQGSGADEEQPEG
jgi:N utilization substance protein A